MGKRKKKIEKGRALVPPPGGRHTDRKKERDRLRARKKIDPQDYE